MKVRLENYYKNNANHPAEVSAQEVKIRQYPIMIMNSLNPIQNQTCTIERPNTQETAIGGRRGSFNLRYFKRKSSANVEGKSLDMGTKSVGKEISLNQTCYTQMYNQKKPRQSMASHTEASSHSPDPTLLQHFRQQYRPKRRVTNATILRKRFIYEEILPRERKLGKSSLIQNNSALGLFPGRRLSLRFSENQSIYDSSLFYFG